MNRKLYIILGVCLFAVICIMSLWRAGLLQHNQSNLAAAVNPAQPPIPVATAAPVAVPPKASSALEDSDSPSFIALRYDNTHVIFRLGDEGDFSLEDPEQEKTFVQLPGPVAEYGGVPPSEIEHGVFESVKQHYQVAHIGDQWQLEVSSGVRVPVVIQKPIEMSWGCSPNSFTAGFIAEVIPEVQALFGASPQKYFLVHKAASPPDLQTAAKPVHILELKDWKPTPEVRSQIEQLMTTTIKDDIAREAHQRWDRDKDIRDPGIKAEYDAWRQFAEKTAAGQGKLTYETQAFQLSPDGYPRVLVRAQWMEEEDKARAFLISAWLRTGPTVAIEDTVKAGTRTMWSKPGSNGEDDMSVSQLTIVLNVFDRPDGYGDVLIYTPGYEGYSMTVYRYTDKGWADTNISMGDGC